MASQTEEEKDRIYDAFYLPITRVLERANSCTVHDVVEPLALMAARQQAVARQQMQDWEMYIAQDVLRCAFYCDMDVYQVVLDGVNRQTLAYRSHTHLNVLGYPLWERKKAHTMAMVERLRREKCEMGKISLVHLIEGRLFGDEEVEEAVLGVLHPSVTEMPVEIQCLTTALDLKDEQARHRAVDLCLRLGPPMADMVENGDRLCFVRRAWKAGDVTLVRKLHDLLPLLADGSGRRAKVLEYTDVINDAYNITSVMEPAVVSATKCLVELGGREVLRDCYELPRRLPTAEDMEWLIEEAPELVVQECQHCNGMFHVLKDKDEPWLVAEQLVRLLDRRSLRGMMRYLRHCETRDWRIQREDGWRWMLKALHEAVPECMDGLRFRWLMEAVEAEEYRDVEYMLGMCTVEHLTERNEDGDRAYDVAERNRWFPKELLRRLVKAPAKGAHA